LIEHPDQLDISATNDVSLGWDYLFGQPILDHQTPVFGDAGSTEITVSYIFLYLNWV